MSDKSKSVRQAKQVLQGLLGHGACKACGEPKVPMLVYTEVDKYSHTEQQCGCSRHRHSGSKYLRPIQTKDGKVDVYAVLDAFGVTCPARQHAIKKLLCSGVRGKGDTLQDLREARDAVERSIELQTGREGGRS